MRLLIVDDEEKIRSLVKKYALFEGYEVDEGKDGMEAIEKAQEVEYDIIIMDIMMPQLDGFSACKEIRKKSQVPVIMLSARGEEYDKIHGFELGIDDYVVKPFSPKELMMRAEAIIRRSRQKEGPGQMDEVNIGDLNINITARLVTINNNRIDLSPKEYDLLFYMVKNRGIALSREKLITQVWGYDFYGDDRTLDTHIKLLRKSLGAYQGYIATVRGVGYRFEQEIHG